ncbi:hypothetical protein Pfo_009482 [Paulownia fortunei]|nr:hypothetical protein Pfo_009482 [Paulownia fortunei]
MHELTSVLRNPQKVPSQNSVNTQWASEGNYKDERTAPEIGPAAIILHTWLKLSQIIEINNRSLRPPFFPTRYTPTKRQAKREEKPYRESMKSHSPAYLANNFLEQWIAISEFHHKTNKKNDTPY